MVVQENRTERLGQLEGNKMKWNELIDLIDEHQFGESDVKLLTANNDIVDVMCVAIEKECDDVILIGERL